MIRLAAALLLAGSVLSPAHQSPAPAPTVLTLTPATVEEIGPQPTEQDLLDLADQPADPDPAEPTEAPAPPDETPMPEPPADDPTDCTIKVPWDLDQPGPGYQADQDCNNIADVCEQPENDNSDCVLYDGKTVLPALDPQ